MLAQQVVEKHGRSHDIRRTVKLTSMGLFVIGPGLRTWYIVLDKIIKGAPGTAALKKMLLDQGVWAPFFIALFFSLSDSLDGKSFQEIKSKLEVAYVPALKVNWMIWPFVQLANFYVIPLQHRIMVVNFVALFWNMYLAWATHQGEQEEH